MLSVLTFGESYDAGYDAVKEVADQLEVKWLNREPTTFYELENPYRFGERTWSGLNLRKNLISICRYLFLHSSFDSEYWVQFMTNTPQEAETITQPWSDEELLFVI